MNSLAGTYKMKVKLSVYRRKSGNRCWDSWGICNDPEPFGSVTVGEKVVRLPATCRNSRFCTWKNDIKEHRIVVTGSERVKVKLMYQDIQNHDYIGSCDFAFAAYTKITCGRSIIEIWFTKVE